MLNKGLFGRKIRNPRLSVTIFIMMLAPCVASALDILFVSPRGEPYESVYAAFSTQIVANDINIQRISPDAADIDSSTQPPDLIVASGTDALRYVIGIPLDRSPVLSILVPRETFTALAPPSSRQMQISALWLDVPASEKIMLINRHLGSIRKIGVLRTHHTQPQFDAAAHKMAHELGIELIEQVTVGGHEIIDDLTALARRVDAILAIPDVGIYGRNTISRVLLTAYRHRTPIIGYSDAFTKAGAAMSISSTPEDLGREAADLVLDTMLDGELPSLLRHTRKVNVSFNRQVARSLGIEIRE